AIPTSLTTSRDGSLLAAGCDDGSIQAWDLRRNVFVNSSICMRECHAAGNAITSISFAYTDKLLCSRSMDDTLKLWDIRATKKCLHSFEDLFNRFPMTDCSFSPDDKMIFTGTSTSKENPKEGKVVFFK